MASAEDTVLSPMCQTLRERLQQLFSHLRRGHPFFDGQCVDVLFGTTAATRVSSNITVVLEHIQVVGKCFRRSSCCYCLNSRCRCCSSSGGCCKQPWSGPRKYQWPPCSDGRPQGRWPLPYSVPEQRILLKSRRIRTEQNAGPEIRGRVGSLRRR